MIGSLFLLCFVLGQNPVKGQEWWSLKELRRPVVPKVRKQGWVRNPIDAFVLAELEKRGLEPAPSADRTTLIRRVTFDLLGVPPTPQESADFVKDKSPNVYEKLLDRLLADKRYGERWGRHWLDVARFGESQGFERDKIRDHAWRYRDYVIQAFNQDKPYRQFVQEQIAGDVLEPVTHEGMVATGFLVSGPWDEVGNTQISEVMRLRVREEELEDMVSVVSQSFLGMTVNCARCHNHKFDPIPQTDYYRIKSALEGVRHGDRVILTPEEQKIHAAQLAQLRQQIAEKELGIAALEEVGRKRVLAERGQKQAVSGPIPMARWTFETDGRDGIGNLHGTLRGGAKVGNGRLHLNGMGAFMETAPLSQELREKTLEAWVSLANLTQRGGGVLSLETQRGGTFDSIVFGEQELGKWMAGSESFHRTRSVRGKSETAKPGEWVHLAAVYHADNRITLYRNGLPYGESYQPEGEAAILRTYPKGTSHLLFGLRHTGAGNGFLAGEIEEARLYSRALRADEIASSFQTGVDAIASETVLHALTPDEHTQRQTLQTERSQLQEALQRTEPMPLSYAANPLQPEPTSLLLRGDVEKRGEIVSPGGLSCVRTLPADFGLKPDAPEGQRRLKLAQWIAHPNNPLTSRVLVNRVWHYHFGRGIVGSPNDFGFNGERPSHPELLDWLASTFTSDSFGWSLKKLHRLMMLSNTYRQSARYNPQAARVDAEDRGLWRFAPRRLEGEAVRDAMLCVSGQINEAEGGPSFRPFTLYVNNSNFYTLVDRAEPEYNRRTVYRINVQSAKSPLLETLDCPDPSTKTPRRTVTTTPLQALELMNNSFVVRQSRCFAERLSKEAGKSLPAQIALAYRLAFGRFPTQSELTRSSVLVKEHRLENLCWALLNASEFLYLR